MLWLLPVALALASGASAHVSAFAKGMYCEGGPNPNKYDPNSNAPVNPLFNLPKEKWWMQADRGCDKAPPPNNASMELPAGGQFTVELAHNQGQTTLSFGGEFVSDWPDGGKHPEDWGGSLVGEGCIQDDGAMHTQNQSMATGTAFAISYQSDISKVTMENLVVFTTLEHTPWKRIATYEVPKDLPPCPSGGCYCAWLWIPHGCGIPNMYMSNFACHVTNSTSTKQLAVAKPPVYCADDQSKCVKGAKQMLAWNQATGNNVRVPDGASPAYGPSMGWAPGAQNDIFVVAGNVSNPVGVFNSVSPIQVSSTAASIQASSAVKSVPTTLATIVAPTTSALPAQSSGHAWCNAGRYGHRYD